MILVTGGTGLVGSHLLYHLLLEENSVKAIHQKTSDINAVKKVFSYYTSDFENLFKNIIWIEADLCNIPLLENAFKDIDRIYHCAALVSFNLADYKKMRKINIEGTSNIVNLCISNKIKKLCFVSSIAAIEKNKNDKLINEIDNWNNVEYKNCYSITKYGAEMEVWRASQENVDVVIVNPGIILGSGFWNKGTGEIFTRIYKGFNFYTKGVTGFVGVKDVVQVMQKLMNSNIKNERFILVSKNDNFKNIFFKIADNFNKKRPHIKVSSYMSEVFWRLDFLKSKITGKAPLITKNSARSSHSKNYYSSKKIETTLSYKFESIDKTIQNICKDYLK